MDIDLTPPSYNNIPSAGKAVDGDVEVSWDKKCPADWQKQPWNFSIMFGPNTQNQRSHMDWEARLQITAKNLPRLMRQGFHWSIANVQKGEGYFVSGKNEVHNETENFGNDWHHARIYCLRDLAEPAQWVARLLVLSDDIPMLSRFRVEDISIDQIQIASALNWDKQCIYHYDVKTAWAFNAIYEDTPLDGWWPWPKKEKKP